MTINGLQCNTSTVFAGLGTSTYNVVTAGLYTVAFTSTIPYRPAGSSFDSSSTVGGSELLVVINLNGSPMLTSTLPTPTQPSVGGSVRLQCAANDVITVVLSSADIDDNTPNAVKTVINLFQGE